MLTKVRDSRHVGPLMLFAAICFAATGLPRAEEAGGSSAEKQAAGKILAANGVKGGLVVHLGCMERCRWINAAPIHLVENGPPRRHRACLGPCGVLQCDL